MNRNIFRFLKHYGYRSYSSSFLLNNEPVRNLQAVQSRIKNSEETFFEVNLDHIVHQWHRWRELMPRIRPYYAVKCQPDRKVIHALAALGAGFDCASKEEINVVIQTFKDAFNQHDSTLTPPGSVNDIIFANPFKFQQDMEFARNNNVEVTTFDSESELLRIHKYWPEAKLIIRISTRKQYLAKCQLGDKFGANETNIPLLLKRAREFGFDVIGISFHVGNLCDDFSAWPETVEYCSQIFQLMQQMEFNPYLLDIGGGFPGISSLITEEEMQLQARFEKMTRELNSCVDTYFNQSTNRPEQDLTIIAEPGTYFVHGAYTLVTEVIGKRNVLPDEYDDEFADDPPLKEGEQKIVKDGSLESFRFVNIKDLSSVKKNVGNIDDSKRFVYILDDGVYGSFNHLQFMQYKYAIMAILHPDSTIKNLVDNSPNHISKIYGPTCDLLDCITKCGEIIELEVGDWLVWPDMGAYTNSSRSDFNGITCPVLYYHVSDEISHIVEQTRQNVLQQRKSLKIKVP